MWGLKSKVAEIIVGWKIGPFDNFLKYLNCVCEEERILLSYSSRRVLRFEIMAVLAT